MFKLKKKALFTGVTVLTALTLSACGVTTSSTNSSSTKSSKTSNSSTSSSSSQNKKAKTIALLLPDTTSSARYETQDKPDFIKGVQSIDPSIKVDYENAQGDATTQQQQAESAITNGASLLVVDPVDSKAAATIVNEAAQAGVKVISYDRMINGAVDYYVSFDNEKVGELQGQYMADHTKKGGTIVMIDGAQTDNNALLFAQGAHKILDPLFKNGTFKHGYETYTPNWDPANGLREMEQSLTKLSNHVDGVLSANDGLAGSIIQALHQQGLAGKVPVTGQDATDAGLHDIMLGLQSMTVYKAVPKEAQAAAQLAVDLVNGTTPPSSLVTSTVNNGTKDVSAVLLQPVVVTKDNIQSTVIADGFTTMDKINNPAASK